MDTPEVTALITGASGFGGSRLAAFLAARNWHVHVLVRPVENLDQLAPCRSRIHLHETNCDVADLTETLRAVKPDVVFHLASLFLAAHTPEDVPRLIAANLTYGTSLLEALCQTGVRRLINTGTSWQHYENAAYNPVNLYAATKQAFEDILAYYVEAHRFRAITLKLFDTYGAGDPRPKLFHLLKKYADTGIVLDMSPGEQLIDLVHVDDVCSAFAVAAWRLLAGKDLKHETFAISSGNRMTLRELVARFNATHTPAVKVNFGTRPYRTREVMVPWSAGHSLPGWQPSQASSAGFNASAILAREKWVSNSSRAARFRAAIPPRSRASAVTA